MRTLSYSSSSQYAELRGLSESQFATASIVAYPIAFVCGLPIKTVPHELLLPVVNAPRMSAMSDAGMTPGRLAQVVVDVAGRKFGLALFEADTAPIGDGPSGEPLPEVPDGGAITPRTRMSYRLMACTS